MLTQKCETCGAPVDPAEPGSVVTCAYCHARMRAPTEVARHIPDALPPRVARPWNDDAEPPRERSIVRFFLSAVAAIGVVGAAVFVLVSSKNGGPPKTATPTLRAASLKTLGDTETTIDRIDPTGIQGELRAFDPIRNLPWATKLASTWSADARLTTLTIVEMTLDGALDVSDRSPATARYVFVSAGRDAAARDMAKASSKLVWSAIALEFKKGLLTATVSPNSAADRDRSEIVFGCLPADVLALWRTRGLPIRDGYALTLREEMNGEFDWTSQNWGVKPLTTSCKDTK
jgi:hypothetical protein